jgi:hypothetical protein
LWAEPPDAVRVLSYGCADFPPSADHQGNFVTTTVFVGAIGTDSVFLTINGQFESSGGGKCLLTSTGTYTVTGGTGAFLNATGSGIITTRIDQCAGTAEGTYTGTISQPNSG